MKRVILIDGSNLIYRAFFALPKNLIASDGTPTNAVYGFALMFNKILQGKDPSYGAVIFDAKGATDSRKEKYAEYKATRAPMPDDLRAQLPYIKRLCRKNGFAQIDATMAEADDVIGTLSRQAKDAGYEVTIVSSDKDFAQLIDDRCRMLDTLSDTTFDAELTKKKWGVRPDQMIDFLALVGDASDNVPGVPRIGEKSALSLLERFDSLEKIYAHLDAHPDDKSVPTRQRNALREGRELAFLSQDLVTIVQDLDLDFSLESIALKAPDLPALNALYHSLEFYSLIQHTADGASTGDTDALPEGLTLTDSDTLSAFLSHSDGPIALWPLTHQVPPAITPLFGFALSHPDGTAALCLKERMTSEAWQQLCEWLDDPEKPKDFHDYKEALRPVRRAGLNIQGVHFDTRLASFLIDPNKPIPHPIERVTKEYLQRQLMPIKDAVGSGRKETTFDQIPEETLKAWAIPRAQAIAALSPLLSDKVDEAGQRELFEVCDLPLSDVLAQMELDGVLVDREDLEKLSVEFGETLKGYEAEILALAGRDFNVASPKQLGEILFDELGLPVIKRTKTGYSTDAEVLEKLRSEHPIAGLVIKYRQLAKLINTYTDVLVDAIYPPTGRVHTTFHQTHGVTGRLITTDPDLQRTPIHTPEGRRIREAFIAPEGRRILVADWSQIELRILAHLSGDPVLVAAFQEGLDIHRRTASQLFGKGVDEISSEERDVGKTVNFATIYGQGATSLATLLDIPRQEAARYIDAYFELYQGVRQWLDATTEEALQEGAVSTMKGRRRLIPELHSRNPRVRQLGIRMACNSPIQGSASDLCKFVMLEIDAMLRRTGLDAKMLLQIHDELVFEVAEADAEALGREVKALMENPKDFALSVPLVVDLGVGGAWA